MSSNHWLKTSLEADISNWAATIITTSDLLMEEMRRIQFFGRPDGAVCK
jgi:hypothetical protein